MQICITSYGEILSPGGLVTHVDQEDAVKQEEPEDENDLCKTVGPVRPTNHTPFLGSFCDWVTFTVSSTHFCVYKTRPIFI